MQKSTNKFCSTESRPCSSGEDHLRVRIAEDIRVREDDLVADESDEIRHLDAHVLVLPVEYVAEEQGVGDEEDDVAREVKEEVALHPPPLEVEIGLHDGVEEHLARRCALEVEHVLQDAVLVLAAAAVLQVQMT